MGQNDGDIKNCYSAGAVHSAKQYSCRWGTISTKTPVVLVLSGNLAIMLSLTMRTVGLLQINGLLIICGALNSSSSAEVKIAL
jgi:hypothetical protein